MSCASHLQKCLDCRQIHELVLRVRRRIINSHITFDTIACRGISGIVVASIVASELGKPLCIVRKRINPHGLRRVEYCGQTVGKYIVIDDFILSGQTIRAIIDKIAASSRNSILMGIFLYQNTEARDTTMDTDWTFRNRKKRFGVVPVFQAYDHS